MRLTLFAALNLSWELVQLPLYTMGSSGTTAEVTFAILHYTAGDVIIDTGIWAITGTLLGGRGVQSTTAWLFSLCFSMIAVA